MQKCTKQKGLRDPYPVLFENNRGERIILSSGLTMKDLVAMGITIRLVPEQAPLKNGEFQDVREGE